MTVEEIRSKFQMANDLKTKQELFKSIRATDEMIAFLESAADRHTGLYHYTNLTCLKSMLQESKLHFSLGRTMNDLRELQKCNPEKWERLYVLSLSYADAESMAMWHLYCSPFSQAVRIQFSGSSIRNWLKREDEIQIYEAVRDEKTSYFTYQPLSCTGVRIRLFDIAYLKENNNGIYWHNALLKKEDYPDLDNITSQSNLAGYLKNCAWRYENETRILIELPEGLQHYPEKIAVSCKSILDDARILCGPCLPKDVLQEKIRVFFENRAIRESRNLWKVHFRTACETCKEKGRCLL